MRRAGLGILVAVQLRRWPGGRLAQRDATRRGSVTVTAFRRGGVSIANYQRRRWQIFVCFGRTVSIHASQVERWFSAAAAAAAAGPAADSARTAWLTFTANDSHR